MHSNFVNNHHVRSYSTTTACNNNNESSYMRYNDDPYSNFVDVNQRGPETTKFSWHSSSGSSGTQPYEARTRHYSVVNRPFESSFKSAISKIKESTLTRLSNVDKSKSFQQPITSSDQQDYGPIKIKYAESNQPIKIQPLENKSIRTHQVQSNSAANTVHEVPLGRNPPDYSSCARKNIYRCNSTSTPHINREDLSSYKQYQKFSYQPNQEDIVGHKKTQSLDRSQSKKGQVFIPVQTVHVQQNPPVEETIQVKSLSQVHSVAPPKLVKINNNRSEDEAGDQASDPDIESLPTVKEIIAKVEALNQWEPSDTKTPVSPSITKPPVVEPTVPIVSHRRSNSFNKPPMYQQQQEQVQQYPGQYYGVSKPTLGTYTKGGMASPVLPIHQTNASDRLKTLNNLPTDFQKLHTAFLDQKKEIAQLKRELDSKNAKIAQLETDLRNYEPWR